jgi:hypothetical protein
MPMTDPNIACTSSTLLKNGSNYDGEKSRLQTIKLDLGGELVDIPKVLVEDVRYIFFGFLISYL